MPHPLRIPTGPPPAGARLMVLRLASQTANRSGWLPESLVITEAAPRLDVPHAAVAELVQELHRDDLLHYRSQLRLKPGRAQQAADAIGLTERASELLREVDILARTHSGIAPSER